MHAASDDSAADIGSISYVGVGFFLEGSVGDQLIAISERLASSHESWWRLSQEQFPPHITCWLAYMPAKNLPTLLQTVAKLCCSIRPFQARIGEAHQEASGHIMYGMHEQSEFRRIHGTLLPALNPLREGFIHPKYADRLASMSCQERSNVQTYGTRFAASLFAAHVTVAVAPRQVGHSLAALAPALSMSTQMDCVTVWRQAASGVSVEVLGAYHLEGPCERS